MFSKLVILAFLFVSCQAFSQTWNSTQSDTAILIEDAVITDTIETTIDSLKIEEQTKLKPIFSNPFSEQSNFITKTDILRNDYRYTGDFFKIFPFSFERSFGFIGQPNDIYLYGEGKSTTSYFVDGVPIRVSDFNHIQSEDIDSIEIVPLPRGFLYGFTTNPVSVNFISKDIIPTKPYSRIKYYEGPFGEAFIDAIFSMNLFKDLIASVDITNRKVDDSYKNSAFSIWQAKAKLRYNLSNEINLIGSYYFSKSTTGINGGVNVNKIKQTTSDINTILYNETLAPVYSENNSLNFKQHNFGLKLLAEPFENAITDLSLYYQFYRGESHNLFLEANKDKRIGVILNQSLNYSPLKLNFLCGYQSLHFYFNRSHGSSSLYDLKKDMNEAFFSSLISMNLFGGTIVPTLFFNGKHIELFRGEGEYYSSGTDISIQLTEQANIFLGYSKIAKYLMEKPQSLFELKFSFNVGKDYIILRGFNKSYQATSLWGIGIEGNYTFSKFLFSGRFCQQLFTKENDWDFVDLPEAKFSFGLYFKDSLFNSNLDLKAGFVSNYLGKQNMKYLLLRYASFNTDGENSLPLFTIDFTLSAEIQKNALVYFTWENLLDKQYYITPYYPMLQRNIRFGLAWEILN